MLMRTSSPCRPRLGGPWPCVVGVLVLFGAAVPVSAEIRNATASGFTIENTRVVPVDAATAFEALVERVDAWWPKDHTWWGKEGTLSIPDGRCG